MVQNKDLGPKGRLVPGLPIPEAVVLIGIVAPFTPGGSVSRENSYSRDRGG